MDWDHARIFLAVARAGQFLAAARHLGVDHATVSRRVSACEAQLGAKLFDRRTMGCFLTPAGEQFLVAAERMEAEMLRVQAALSSSNVSISGTVRIGAPDGFGTLFLTQRIAKLMDHHPGLTIQLVPVPRTFSLSKREADIAIVIDRPEEGRLVVRKLVDYTLHFYAAKTYLAQHGAPQSLEDLSAHPLVTYVQDILFSHALNFVPQLYGPLYRRFECASALGQASAVAAGAGIGVLHDYASWHDPMLQIVLPDVVFQRSYWLVTHADTRDLMRVKTVSDFIMQEVRAARGLFTPA
jgi:DNA-binding transcriptional LysR family regulator